MDSQGKKKGRAEMEGGERRGSGGGRRKKVVIAFSGLSLSTPQVNWHFGYVGFTRKGEKTLKQYRKRKEEVERGVFMTPGLVY